MIYLCNKESYFGFGCQVYFKKKGPVERWNRRDGYAYLVEGNSASYVDNICLYNKAKIDFLNLTSFNKDII